MVEAKLTTVGTQLPGMEDYMMAKSLQDQQKKFVMEPPHRHYPGLWPFAQFWAQPWNVLHILQHVCVCGASFAAELPPNTRMRAPSLLWWGWCAPTPGRINTIVT